ncbi:MAG: alanine racemase [Deltaproteobacteria bacterium RIFCSPLOWO2_12_FULL_43_16]|nr:MAG: alanine racemase [Deltaproteobacteria bacterium GWA2_43_19]OGQ11574.1 MAG: alanine racemase [Deltaproteobacteria bacterium RIFCSPHIGHO2_02_FULL_43_33]OGQ37136.1 MAG: alanine racemase [Deltaproteobacteria bacterium RIFCSPLOWO2_01_FULL_42_9]OGQ60872.1 MAG: alanine racemase [Deltaproteobacteria bacterium RIFCSPLOWO2_12_FULL_43_16]HBR16129.1 alanine racemase [Deltaproteobacteria bacterium]
MRFTGRPTFAIIDRVAIRSNFLQIKKNVDKGVDILAVVKANAYGHGAVETAKTLEQSGCRFFGVAICEEGVELRKAGIKSSIIVLGGVYPNQTREIIKYNLTPVIFDGETARILNNFLKKADKKIKVHIKIDTGMGRLGLLPEEIEPFFNKLKGLANLEVEGILSHFAEADEEDKGFSKKQLAIFLKAIKVIQRLGFKPRFQHIANSAALLEYNPSHFNMVRPGIMLYGAYPALRMKEQIRLKPVMRLVTNIVQLKDMPKGFSVSYGRKYVAKKRSIIAAIPIGYGDGYPRSLSGKGEVLVRGKRVRVAGTICMDITMLDVTHIKGVSVGDEAVIIGKQGNDEIKVDELAEKAGTIPYEILCGITSRIPRVYPVRNF